MSDSFTVFLTILLCVEIFILRSIEVTVNGVSAPDKTSPTLAKLNISLSLGTPEPTKKYGYALDCQLFSNEGNTGNKQKKEDLKV